MSTNRILFAVLLLFAPLDVYAQAPLLWELQEDIHGGTDLVRAITLSGKSAVIVGNGGVPLEGTNQSDFVIQALSQATGTLQWSDRTFLSGGTVEPLHVTSHKDRAYAVGTLRELGDPRSAFLVRAYAVPTGTLLWENVWHASAGGDQDHPTGIFASPTHVVVVGSGDNATHDGRAALVRAFDPLTGEILWEDRVGSTGTDILPWAIAADRQQIFVAGTVYSRGDVRDLFLRAYDASTGDLTWEIGRAGVEPATLHIASGRLLVAGAAGSTTYLAAFSAKTGASLWDDMVPTSGRIVDMAVAGRRIAAAISFGTSFAVRAYSLMTGGLEWENRPTISPGFLEEVHALVLNQHTVYAAGFSGETGMFGNSEFLVRAYDAADGSLLWDDRSHASTATAALDLALGKFGLFAAGYTFDSSTGTDFLIRAYDVR